VSAKALPLVVEKLARHALYRNHQTLAATAQVEYVQVAAVYVTANVAVIIAHIPGGLRALVAFRIVYFLIPLALGGCAFALAKGLNRSQA
jgi:glycosyltransferase 2 family protein